MPVATVKISKGPVFRPLWRCLRRPTPVAQPELWSYLAVPLIEAEVKNHVQADAGAQFEYCRRGVEEHALQARVSLLEGEPRMGSTLERHDPLEFDRACQKERLSEVHPERREREQL